MAIHGWAAWGTERVIHGEGAFHEVGREVERLGVARVFVLLSATLARETEVRADLRRLLGDRIAGWQVGMPQHMPRPAILELAAAARRSYADLLLCIGGGSIVDSAKLVQLCLSENVTASHQLDAFVSAVSADGHVTAPAIAPQRVRTLCVPTTLSAAEFTGRAGCVDPERSLKQIFVHREFAPRVVILDPLLTRATPRGLWLSSGMRAVDHAVEGLCSPAANLHSDGLASNGLRLLADGLRRCAQDDRDLQARLQCQLGAWSAIGVLQAGATMGASHGIGHALGAFGVQHGHTSCAMLAPVLRFNRGADEDRQRRVAGLLGAPDTPAYEAVDRLVRDLGLPSRLREMGLARDRLPAVAEAAMKDRWIHTNPRRIGGASDVLRILESAW